MRLLHLLLSRSLRSSFFASSYEYGRRLVPAQDLDDAKTPLLLHDRSEPARGHALDRFLELVGQILDRDLADDAPVVLRAVIAGVLRRRLREIGARRDLAPHALGQLRRRLDVLRRRLGAHEDMPQGDLIPLDLLDLDEVISELGENGRAHLSHRELARRLGERRIVEIVEVEGAEAAAELGARAVRDTPSPSPRNPRRP